jgi:metal-responsive CopG/Arc/MetJ family transcriptional regulator
MKTAVSVPDPIYDAAEELARRLKRSRSAVYSAALGEYIARHQPEQVTEAMNRVCEALDTRPDGFVSAAARKVLEKTGW